MERQNTLNNELSKEEQIEKVLLDLKMYNKIIKYFGDVNSKIMILGEAPIQSHVDSTSQSCFKFDEDLEVNAKSGAVLINVFKELNLKIEDYFWDNLYSIPVEKVINKRLFHEIMERKIEIINPNKIICLGSECFNIIKNLDLNVNINIKKIYHPGYVLRGGVSLSEYKTKFRKTLE